MRLGAGRHLESSCSTVGQLSIVQTDPTQTLNSCGKRSTKSLNNCDTLCISVTNYTKTERSYREHKESKERDSDDEEKDEDGKTD